MPAVRGIDQAVIVRPRSGRVTTASESSCAPSAHPMHVAFMVRSRGSRLTGSMPKTSQNGRPSTGQKGAQHDV